MNLFEYQGKQFFAQYGIPIPKGILIADPLDIPPLPEGGVVKPQILMGGRGKAGAIKICNNEEEAVVAAEYFLKTPIKGHLARKILIEKRVAIAEEYYFSISINRSGRCISLMFSGQGGVEIERGASEKVERVDINPLMGLRPFMVKKLLAPFQLVEAAGVEKIIQQCYQLFMDKKMLMLEINPLAVTEKGGVVALDAKVSLDDWAIDSDFQTEEQEGGDLTEFERGMAEANVTAVEMDGDIVVFGAGAGVAMATADSIVQRGGTVRAIIDLGTLPSDSPDEGISIQAAETEKLILTLNPKVILINFYFQAGRMDYECLTLKRAFGEAAERIPIVLRCKGRMAQEGKKLLEDTKIFVTDSYEEACAEAIRRRKEG